MTVRLTKLQALILRLVHEQTATQTMWYVHDYHYRLKDGTDIYIGSGPTHEGFTWSYGKRPFESLVRKGLLKQHGDIERMFSVTLSGQSWLMDHPSLEK